MTERKLVTVRRVASLSPIPNADRIEVATIDGSHSFKCVSNEYLLKEK